MDARSVGTPSWVGGDDFGNPKRQRGPRGIPNAGPIRGEDRRRTFRRFVPPYDGLPRRRHENPSHFGFQKQRLELLPENRVAEGWSPFVFLGIVDSEP